MPALLIRTAICVAPLLPGVGRACAPLCSEELSSTDVVRLTRARLTEEWSASVRRRKPRFLPFIGARQWARAMPLDTEDEWMNWLADGEKRNPYIPSRPDEVYADAGWAGWDDFLNGPVEPAEVATAEGYRRGKWLKGPLRDVKEIRTDDGDDRAGRYF